jgi:hypothetical protein
VFKNTIKDAHKFPGIIEVGDKISTHGTHTINGYDLTHTSTIEYGVQKPGRPKKFIQLQQQCCPPQPRRSPRNQTRETIE